MLKRFSSGRPRKPLSSTEGNINAEATLSQGFSNLSVQEEEILIAVVGITGSGKSSFIKRITKQNDIEIGEGLCSMTQDVKEYKYTAHGKTFKLIDTPGFDDTEVDDEDIFESLVEWLEKSYRKGQRVTGLLYLHRIISNREKGSDLRNLRVFQKLCGDKSFSNVVIGITWWDQEDPDVADSREKVLKESDEFWGGMVKNGAQVVRMPLDEQGCVNLLMNLSGRQTTTLAVQDEIVNQGKSAKQTDAATALISYDRLQAERDSEHLDQLAQDIRQKAQILKRQQEAARRQDEERAKYEEEEERILAETEALLQEKKQKAEAFRERTEARRRRMEELQRQLLEAEGHIEAAERTTAEFETRQSPIAASSLTYSPTDINNSQSQPASRKSSGVPLSQLGPEIERLRQTQNTDQRFTVPRIEEERRRAELRRQFAEQAEKQKLEAERLEKEKRDREYAEKVAAELRKAEEERKRMAELIEQEAKKLADMLAQAQQPAQGESPREQSRVVARSLRHIKSMNDWMRVFANYQPLANTWIRQGWRGLSYNINGQSLAGPLQGAFCDFCLCHLPCGEGHWSCDQCMVDNSSGLAICNACKASRPTTCFSASHTPVFKAWSDDFQHGPYFTCSRLSRRFMSDSLICSKCRDPLGVVFLHCCACDNDDFDMCIKCWGDRLLRCNVRSHTLYLHAWTPPNERRLLGSY